MSDRPKPVPRRMRIAAISGLALRHAESSPEWRARRTEPSPEEAAGFRSELEREGLADPGELAEWCGILRGAHEGEDPVIASRYLFAARLLELAGADQSLIPQWVEEGRRRAGSAERQSAAIRRRNR